MIVLILLTIAAAVSIGPRVSFPSPLLLLAVGTLVGLMPFVPAIDIDPEWILAGVLPPLLYSAAVSVPAMDFRREFTGISVLATLLVVVTSFALGVLFTWLIPGLSLAWGVALGAIISPTDAVATTIVKRAGVSPRVVALLEGEGLLNDASALVALHMAIASAAAAFAFWGAIGTFVWAVVAAAVIGVVVGRANLAIRRRTPDATVNTIVSFTVPFLASIPAEVVGASGLVAAVVAGLVTNRRAPRVLSPLHRLSDSQNWATIEMVLEGLIFLTMGLQLFGIVESVRVEHAGLPAAGVIAAVALVIALLIRAGFVAPLLRASARRRQRGIDFRERLDQMQAVLAESPQEWRRTVGPRQTRVPTEREIARFSTRVRRAVADIDYFTAQPLDWRDGAIVVWAGMRGAVTVAAAQTLPTDAPHRQLLILVAFLVAAGSLTIQGGTIFRVVRALKPGGPDEEAERAERGRLLAMLRGVADAPPLPADDTPEAFEAHRLARIAQTRAQREALLDARDDGLFSAEVLGRALANLDAEEITLGLRGG